MDLRAQLLEWITEDLPAENAGAEIITVPIQILLVKAALARKGESVGSTESTEISLQVFERAAVCRNLKELQKEGLISFVDKSGTAYEPDERELTAFTSGEPSKVKYVALKPPNHSDK